MEIFSTITSPVFSDLVFIILRDQFPHLLSDVTFLETLRMMTAVRPFKLAFVLKTPHYSSMDETQNLRSALATVVATGLLNFLDSPPTLRVE